jgi:nucleotide-binding universal stress UspA family protein
VYSKILVPLDGSKLAECSLDHLKPFTDGETAPEIVLLRVIEPMYSDAAAAWAQGGYTIADAEKRSKGEAEDYISHAAERLAKEGIVARGEVVFGRAAEAIMDYSEQKKVDLIVISTQGRSGISRWAFGSVAYKVAHHSKIPVLLISPAGCRENKQS